MTTSRSENLDDFPEALRDETVYPWEDSEEPVLWQFGERAGTPLEDFSSNALLRMRGEVERKNGKGFYFAPLIQAIDDVLFERGGL